MFHSERVPNHMPFLIAIKTHLFAFGILILVTLITFPSLPGFAFSIGIPFGVAFDSAFHEQEGFLPKAFLTHHHTILLDQLDHNLIGCE